MKDCRTTLSGGEGLMPDYPPFGFSGMKNDRVSKEDLHSPFTGIFSFNLPFCYTFLFDKSKML
jgi:hypothetical protein